MSTYQKKNTAVTHTANTAVGSVTQPVYVDADGTVKQTTYGLNVMTGADGTNAGSAGLVPAPAATDNTKFLSGDGTYKSIKQEVFIGTKGTTTFQQFKDAYNSGMMLYALETGDTYGIYAFKRFYTASSKDIFEFTRTYRSSTGVSTQVWTISSTGDDYSDTTTVNQQVNADWTATSGKAQILNKPELFSGNYNDLSNKPNLASVATTGDYDDLTNKPTIPTYNFHGTSFYSTNGEDIGITRDCNSLVTNGHYYYTANGPSGLGEQSTDGAVFVQAYNDNWVVQIAQDYRTGNIFTRSRNNGTWTSWKAIASKNDIPTNVSQFTNDAGYIRSSSLVQAPVIIQTYSNGTSWYRIWSDGWCEQGDKTSIGYLGKTVTVTLLKTYQSVNFGITANWAVSRNMDDNIMPSVVDESTIKLYSASIGSNDTGGTGSCYWITYGYLASGQF